MSNIAIIPARGGSKRIPRKNIKDFCGMPIIGYSINACLEADIFDEVLVSTDDEEIAEVALRLGAAVPFMRTQKNSGDFAMLAEVLIEVLYNYKSKGRDFKNFACVLPTAPFISASRLTEAYNILVSSGFSSVFPVLRFTYPIQRALNVDEQTKNVSMVWPENLNKRSQDLELRYHDAGQFYFAQTDEFLKEQSLFMSNSGVIELSEMEVQDIDTIQDWKIAELKFNMRFT
jgi:N-acylneuraminate cytidylyltransferase